ncbi:MAG: hypothetical protein KBF12_12980 [Sebaldella sp.]|nr:hypothetical protein [Sebaldella sp.]
MKTTKKSNKKAILLSLLGLTGILNGGEMTRNRVENKEEQIEIALSEESFRKEGKRSEFISDEDMLELLTNKLENTIIESKNIYASNVKVKEEELQKSHIKEVKNIIAMNVLENGLVNVEEIKNNRMDSDFEDYIDYEGITNYSYLGGDESEINFTNSKIHDSNFKILAENSKVSNIDKEDIDENPFSVKERIESDIEAYKNYVSELGITPELAYQYEKEHMNKNEEIWISPFETLTLES